MELFGSSLEQRTLFICHTHDQGPAEGLLKRRFTDDIRSYLRNRLVPFWDIFVDQDDVDPGADWRDVIKSRLLTCNAALILMSDKLLNSDFVRSVEYPILYKRHNDRTDPFRLSWILFSPTNIQDIEAQLPGLTGVQSFDSIADESMIEIVNGPPAQYLEYYIRQCSQLKTFLQPIAERLTIISVDSHPAVPAGSNTLRPLASYDLSSDGATTPEYGVPEVEASWVRLGTRLTDAKALILGTTSHVVGISASAAGIGISGDGGVGKTVLATQLANDDEIRGVFPGGIFWIGIGKEPTWTKLLESLVRVICTAIVTNEIDNELLDLARSNLDTPPASVAGLLAALKSLLEASSILVIFDDVWDAAILARLTLSRGRSRLLITSRSKRLLQQLGADLLDLERLSTDESIKFLRGESSLLADSDADVRSVAAQSDGLLIQLALYRGLHESGESWPAVLGRILRHQARVGHSDLASEYRAHAVAIDAFLELDHQRPTPLSRLEALNALAIMPEEAEITGRSLEILWSVSESDANDVIGSLVGRRLADWSDLDQSLRIHDITRDYLRLLNPDLLAENAQFVARIEEYCDGNFPVLARQDSYIRAHLDHHLMEAGMLSRWVDVSLNVEWIATRIVCDGLLAARSDLETVVGHLAEIHNGGPVVDVASSLERVLDRYGPLLRRASILATARGDSTDPVRDVVATLSAKWRGPDVTSRIRLMEHIDAASDREKVEHCSGIRSIAMNESINALVSGSFDESVCLRDLNTGRARARLVGHTASICQVALNSSGEYVSSASYDGSCIIWDASSGAVVERLDRHIGPVRATQWIDEPSPMVVTAGADGTARLWSADTWEFVQTLEGDGSPVWDLAWDTRGRNLAFCTQSGSVVCWSAAEYALKWIQEIATCPIVGLTWSPGGNLLAASCRNGSVAIYNIESESIMNYQLEDGAEPAIIRWSPRGDRIVVGTNDGTVVVLGVDQELGSCQLERLLAGNRGRVQALAWHDDGDRLVSGSYDGTIRRWNTTTGVCDILSDRRPKWNWSAAVVGDGERFAIGDYQGHTTIHPVGGFGHIVSIEQDLLESTRSPAAVWAVAWSPDGSALAVCSSLGLAVYDANAGRLVWRQPCGPGVAMWSACWCSRDGTIVAGDSSGNLSVFRASDGWRVASPINMEIGGIWSVDTSSDWDLTIAAGFAGRFAVMRNGGVISRTAIDGTAFVSAGWTPDFALEERRSLPDSGSAASDPLCRLSCVRISPDGRHLAVGSADGMVRIFSIVDGEISTEPESELAIHSSWTWDVAWETSSRYVVSGGEDGVLARTNILTGEVDFRAHFGTAINAVSVGPGLNGREIVLVAHGVSWTSLDLLP